MCELLVGQSLS